MRARTVVLTTVGAGLLACVPGSPIYVGPPLATFQGRVVVLETAQTASEAEVCVFAADTLCLPTDRDGNYKVQLREGQLLEGGRCTLRFRVPGLRTHIAELTDVQVGTSITVDCGISNRVSLSSGPSACVDIPAQTP